MAASTANRPVGVGFLGAGNVLSAYLHALDRLVPRGLAREGPIFARRTATWEGLRARRPDVRLVASAAEVLEHPDVDLVVVLTPPATHPELVGRALEAGRHVLCEKPLAADARQARVLADRAAAAGLHLLAAPFVQLSPTFRRLWTLVHDGAIGPVHAARAHYGNPGSTWAPWYHQEDLATLGDVGVYNLKSLTALLGPVSEVRAASAAAITHKVIAGAQVELTDPDTWQLVLRHDGGALSSVLASHATVRYRRPALELYGTGGTANLLGDDWDPQGIELWREAVGTWELIEPEDATWLWTDGLREAVSAIAGDHAPLCDAAHDAHLLDVVAAAGRSAQEGGAVAVASHFAPLEALRLEPAPAGGHVHDRTRPLDEQ